MSSRNVQMPDYTLKTPKRRRLGTQLILKSQNVFSKENNGSQCETNSNNRQIATILNLPEKCESPPLPCNQIEFLHDSGSISNHDSRIFTTPSPDLFNYPVEDVKSRELLISCSKTNDSNENQVLSNKCVKNQVNYFEEISEDMFYSKSDQGSSQNSSNNTLNREKVFRKDVENCFEEANKTICGIETNKRDDPILFDTMVFTDSFLLDEKSTIVEELKTNVTEKKNKIEHIVDNPNTFYGLPIITKELFKAYRNIEKFYDWQEECLNLDAIKERRNLIYALPTNGGKTLVAEVLMLREVLNRKHNALFILPFVAIVQEKIWSLSPFALRLEFLVEEYAAGKGNIPPKKRRKKNSIYVATIEKGLALIRSLIDCNRLNEIGLIVVDELHLIGEEGRGSSLETLLTTVLFADQGIQIVGMSATIGNLPDLARFLRADVFEREFRPVQLTEYVKLGDMLHRLTWGDQLDIVPDRRLIYDYSAAATALDPDFLGGLVSEVVPGESCLVFCPTKRNCENVASLLCKLQRREMLSHRTAERSALAAALRSEGAAVELARLVRCGVAYHHAGLSSDERALLEQAFRAGVVSVLCCTSTLAAGVNLPARRVIVRAPLVGRQPLSLAAYRQMVGRAGRAGVCDAGDSVLVCGRAQWPRVRKVLRAGLPAVRSVLAASALFMSAVALRLAADRHALLRLMRTTFRAQQSDADEAEIEKIYEEAVQSLVACGALEQCEDALAVSGLGRAAMRGCMELEATQRLVHDVRQAARGLVLASTLHLLYLVAPETPALPRAHYHALHSTLRDADAQTARALGLTDADTVKMAAGRQLSAVAEAVLPRFHVALMLNDLWHQMPVVAVADKYCVSRGAVQAALAAATSRAWSAARVCEELQLWPFATLFAELAPRLQHCAAPELQQLMELPAVKKARALQLSRAGYKRVEDLAKARATDVAAAVPHLSTAAANHLISAARMMLIEKVENLRAEAEDVMEELNV